MACAPRGESKRAKVGVRWALILAGGDGTRLQDFTRELTGSPIPKQYCRILGERSLLELTLDRAGRFAPLERTVVVLSRHHLGFGQDQLRAMPKANLVVQPCNRDTGPGLVLGLVALSRRDPNATVAVFPSDHFIGEEEIFGGYVSEAAEIVEAFPEKVVVLGIRPDRADSGFGYIQPATPLPERRARQTAFPVACFREKPSPQHAESLVAEGGLWNSFVMVFRVGRMLDLVERVQPGEFNRMMAVATNPIGASARYEQLPAWNFSRQLLSQIPEHLAVLPVENVHWSDWGTREAIENTLRALNLVPPWGESPLFAPVPSAPTRGEAEASLSP